MNPAVRLRLPLLLALAAAPALFAEPAEKPLGRTLDQRFGKLDQGLVFDPRQGAVGNGQTFSTKSAQAPTFQYDQRTVPGKFETKEFSQSKTSWFSKLKFWSKDANLKTGREIPNVNREAETGTSAVKDAREASRTLAVRDVPGGDRAYLGPESKKLKTAVDPKTMADWRNGGESVGYTGKTVERYSNLKPLSIDDVREILNKNK